MEVEIPGLTEKDIELKVSIPKTEKAKPKLIDVKTR